MSTLTIALPDDLDAALSERLKMSGLRSKEEYLLGLVESDCAAGVLAERLGGPFVPIEVIGRSGCGSRPRSAHAARPTAFRM